MGFRNPIEPRTTVISPPNDVDGISNYQFSASGVVVDKACYYCGFSAWETTGTATASFILHNGTDNTGNKMDLVSLCAGESAREFYTAAGFVDHCGAIYAEIVSGSVLGVVRASLG